MMRMMGRAFFAALRPSGPRMAWPEFSLANIGGAFVHALNQRWSCCNSPDDEPRDA
jgi:hypothetical protein